MLSVPIQITRQEIKDFPVDTLRIDERWKDFVDPEQDYRFRKPRGYSKKKKNS